MSILTKKPLNFNSINHWNIENNNTLKGVDREAKYKSKELWNEFFQRLDQKPYLLLNYIHMCLVVYKFKIMKVYSI